jgi:hypothetical protein
MRLSVLPRANSKGAFLFGFTGTDLKNVKTDGRLIDELSVL